MNAHPGILRLALPIALAACGLLGCRTAADSRALAAPVRIDVGSGSVDAIARRAATELADAEILAARAPRAGALDRRFLVRLDRAEHAGSGTLSAFQALFQSALVGTGRFLVVEDPGAPVVLAQVTGQLGDEQARVLLRGPDGDDWVVVRGDLDPPH